MYSPLTKIQFLISSWVLYKQKIIPKGDVEQIKRPPACTRMPFWWQYSSRGSRSCEEVVAGATCSPKLAVWAVPAVRGHLRV